jgi:hypothetical protein
MWAWLTRHDSRGSHLQHVYGGEAVVVEDDFVNEHIFSVELFKEILAAAPRVWVNLYPENWRTHDENWWQ